MSTYTPPAHVRHRPHIDVRLGAIIGLVAALIALGSWVLVDRYTGGGATHDAATLIDKWQAASTAHDDKAITALLTSDAVQWFNGSTISGPKAILDGIRTDPGLKVERTAPVTVRGDFASTFASVTAPSAGVSQVPIVEIYQFKDGKIFRHWAFVLGTTAPFDTAVAP